MGGRILRVSLLLALVMLCSGSWARGVDEVDGLRFDNTDGVAWNAVAGVDFYNLYRGSGALLTAGNPPQCHAYGIPSETFVTAEVPGAGEFFVYLVTAESMLDGEGPPGLDSSGVARPLLGRCTPVLRGHVQNRLGYGSDLWTRERIATLGIQGYIDEQLDPGSIDEANNSELKYRLEELDPPEDIFEIVAQRVVRAVYARRQLEQQYTAFWINHFNTDWSKIQQQLNGAFPPCNPVVPQCDPNYPARAYYESSKAQNDDTIQFRELGFDGTFREIVEVSALSAAMIIYLDTYTNVDDGFNPPNENYARELLELHSMGVNGGYTQVDVERLAEVFTGWTLCKKETADLNDPLAPCLSDYWEDEPPGEIVATFRPAFHACEAKTLFEGTPYESTIPNSCSDPAEGVHDVALALDAIVAHPSTARFISGKILQRFVTDDPSESMIDTLVATWNDAGNPRGVGDLREVLRAALQLDEFLDPERLRDKIKTPLEHYASAIRSVGGRTDGRDVVVEFLVLADHIPHYNPVPTGFPEVGGAWVDTNGVLTRQNFGIALVAQDTAEFGSDPESFLQANGIPTAPGAENAARIVDFLIEMMFGTALSPADRQAALHYMLTDDLGNPADHDSTRIREIVAVLLGLAQFQEQ